MLLVSELSDVGTEALRAETLRIHKGSTQLELEKELHAESLIHFSMHIFWLGQSGGPQGQYRGTHTSFIVYE